MKGQDTEMLPVGEPSAPEIAAALAEFARLSLRAISSTAAPQRSVANALLERLLQVCGAPQGALVLVAVREETPEYLPPPKSAPITAQPLALHGVTEEDVLALLAAGVADTEVMPAQPGKSLWLTHALPVEEVSLRQQRARSQADSPIKLTRALVLLGWPESQRGDASPARARAALAQVEVAAAAVIASSALAERAREREAAVAERERLFREVEEARADWEQTFDAVSDPISIVTSDYRLVRANAAYEKMFGVNRKDCVGKVCFAATQGREVPCAGCPLPRSLETKQPGFVQQERLVTSGAVGTEERRIFQIWTYPVLNARREVERMVEIMKDVTEQERLHQLVSQASALREADHLKAELLGTVSHELRSPLAAIKGYAATLLRHERRLPRAERHEFLLAIDEGTSRLEVIIDRLLQMSELETGTFPVHRTPVDMARVGREAISAIEELGLRDASRQFAFSLHLVNAHGVPAQSVPPITVDPRLMRNVLDNLLENAVKYSPHGGEIELVIGPAKAGDVPGAELAVGERNPRAAPGSGHSPAPPDGDMLWIRVRDRGRGIPAEHLGQIFDRFHRVDTRLTREVDGLGLGLAICKSIVEVHGGAIWAESEPGEGSTFHVLLPMNDPSARPALEEEM